MTHGNLRDASDLLQHEVAATVAALELTDADRGAVRLAIEYAQTIDLSCSDPAMLEVLGPKLLAVLESLGATPAARARMTKGTTRGDAKPNRLAKLRDARQA